MTAMILRKVRPLGAMPVDFLVLDGVIAAIGTDLKPPPAAEEEDGAGALLLPGLIEGHTHLDKTLWGGNWHRNEIGPTRIERIDNERSWRAQAGHDAEARGLALARAFLANGTTRFRSHADIDPGIGVSHMHATMRVRDALKGVAEIQVVAFPQSGILRMPGVEALMDQAMREGADVVGGIDPCQIDRDPVRHLDIVFGLAQRYGKPVDIHLHEPGEMGAFSLDLILERAEALGMSGQVTVSHAFCLGMIAATERDALLDRMARIGMRIATTAPASSPVPSLTVCRAAGVQMYGGNDGIRDTWTPHGWPDMLDRAMHIALRNGMRRDDELGWALDCVTGAAAAGCGFEAYGLAVGCRAELVLVDVETVAEAVVTAPPRRLVVAGGRVIARGGVLVV